MARVILRSPIKFVPATIWDGSTFYEIATSASVARGYFTASGSTVAHTTVCGPGTLFPAGFSHSVFDRIFLRGKLYQAAFSFSWTFPSYTIGSKSFNPRGAGNIGVPVLSGGDVEGSFNYPVPPPIRLFDTGKDGLVNSMLAQGILYAQADAGGGTGQFNTSIDGVNYNFTDAQVQNFNFELSTADDASRYQNIVGTALLDWRTVRTHGGLFYPSIVMGFSQDAETYVAGFGTVASKVYTAGYFNSDVNQDTGVHECLSAGNVDIFGETVPMYATTYDHTFSGAGTGGSGTPIPYFNSASASGSFSAVKYWPYKNAAGTALFDETTGQPV